MSDLFLLAAAVVFCFLGSFLVGYILLDVATMIKAVRNGSKDAHNRNQAHKK